MTPNLGLCLEVQGMSYTLANTEFSVSKDKIALDYGRSSEYLQAKLILQLGQTVLHLLVLLPQIIHQVVLISLLCVSGRNHQLLSLKMY